MEQNDLLRTLYANDARLKQTETKETPPLYLPWAQRVLNPFPLASSGGVWGDQGMPWAVSILAFYVSAFVVGTNNGTNFWTIALSSTPTGTAIASVTTAAIAAGAFARLRDTSITQPPAADADLFITLTATLSPGAIFIAPAVALLRTGN